MLRSGRARKRLVGNSLPQSLALFHRTAARLLLHVDYTNAVRSLARRADANGRAMREFDTPRLDRGLRIS